MAISKTLGVVLNSFDYGDSGQVVTIFSERFGKLSFLGLGVKKPTSKNKYSLITFSLSEFEIFKSRQNSSLSKLKTGVLIFDHLKISEIYDNYLYASAVGSVVEQTMEAGVKNFKLFHNLTFFLEKLSENLNPFAQFVSFLFFNLKYFGGAWALKNCVRCQKRHQIYRCFSFSEYGMVCPNCWIETDEIQDPIWLHFLRNWSQKSFSQAISEFIPINYLIVLGKLLINYYQEVLGIDTLAFHQILKKHIFQEKVFLNYTHSVLTKP